MIQQAMIGRGCMVKDPTHAVHREARTHTRACACACECAGARGWDFTAGGGAQRQAVASSCWGRAAVRGHRFAEAEMEAAVEERDRLAPQLEQAKWHARQLEKRIEEVQAAHSATHKVCVLGHLHAPAPCLVFLGEPGGLLARQSLLAPFLEL